MFFWFKRREDLLRYEARQLTLFAAILISDERHRRRHTREHRLREADVPDAPAPQS